MKVLNLTKKTEHGYTFDVNMGAWIFRGWWFNQNHNNIVPPSHTVGEKRYPLMVAPGTHVRRLRDLVAKMAKYGVSRFDTELDVMGPLERITAPALPSDMGSAYYSADSPLQPFPESPVDVEADICL